MKQKTGVYASFFNVKLNIVYINLTISFGVQFKILHNFSNVYRVIFFSF